MLHDLETEIKEKIKELRKEQRTLLKMHGGTSEEYYVVEDTITMLKEDLRNLRKTKKPSSEG